MSSGPELCAFTDSAFYGALSNDRVTPGEVANHGRATYLLGYLKDIDAKTMVVERDYTDGDYLDDFAAYYVKCFAPYERRCKRLHFFDLEVSQAEFLSLIRGELSPERTAEIVKSYLGFIVARPLPSAIIGRTVLRTYRDDNGRRHYTCTHKYFANLHGVELSVSSLPFQEQDTVLAACATVALWCCFHQTSSKFQTPSPRPAWITRSANAIVHKTRPIPSHGLNVQQICNAVGAIGLEPEVIHIKRNTPLISLLYGHLKMGLPVLLGIRIEGQGLHAITLAGYSLRDNRHLKQEVAGNVHSIPMVGLRIDELYAHDDQIGPFARVHVKPSATVQENVYPVTFEGSWTDKSTGKSLQLAPEVVVVPVYNKIRVTFLDVQQWLTRIHELIRLVAPASDTLEWDVHLTTTNDYKNLLKQETNDPKTLEAALLRQHPKFIWRATLANKGARMVEFLVDATDMSRSLPIYSVTWYNKQLQGLIERLTREKSLEAITTKVLSSRLRTFLSEKSKTA